MKTKTMTHPKRQAQEDRLRNYFDRVTDRGRDEATYGENTRMYSKGERGGILTALSILGIKIEGVNTK